MLSLENMADRKEVTLPDGRPVESLRVVELKQELKKHGLATSGSKSQLVERLKAQIYLEELKQAPVTGGFPNENIVEDESVASNSFIQQYLKQQQEQLKQIHSRDNPEEKRHTIPEGLACEVEELNQSLSQGREEKLDRDSSDMEESSMKKEEAVPEASSTRTSRRSRKQSAPQEDTAEPEQDTRRSKRRWSRSKDYEQEEEVKGLPDPEPMETVDERQKAVSKSESIPDSPGPAGPDGMDGHEAGSAEEVTEPDHPEEKQASQVEGGHDQADTNDEEQDSAGNQAKEEDDGESKGKEAEKEEDLRVRDQEAKKEEDKVNDQEARPGDNPQQQEMEIRPLKEENGSSVPSKQAEDITGDNRDHATMTHKSEKEEVSSQRESASQEKGHMPQNDDLENSENESEGPAGKTDEKDISMVNPPGDNTQDKEKVTDNNGIGASNPEQKRIKLNRSSDLRRVRSVSATDLEEKSNEGATQPQEDQEAEGKSVSGVESVDKLDSSPKRSAPSQDEDEDAEVVPPKRKKVDSEVEGGDQDSKASREEAAPMVATEMAAEGETGSKDDKGATPAEEEAEEGEIQNGDREDEGGQAEEGGSREADKQEDVPQVERASRPKAFSSVSAPIKTKRHSFSSKEKASTQEGQEGSGGVTEPVVKKRRWGSTKKTQDDKTTKTNVNISTELLKGIIPEIKVAAADVLSMEEELEAEQEEAAMETDQKAEPQADVSPRGEDETPAAETTQKRKFVRNTITAPGVGDDKDEESDIDYEEDEPMTRKVENRDDASRDEEEEEEGGEGGEEEEGGAEDETQGSSSADEGEDGQPAGGKEEAARKKAARKEEEEEEEGSEEEEKEEEKPKTKVIRLKTNVRAIVDEPVRQRKREASPAKRPESNIVHILNLVRPFTVNQLKELLGRYGSIVDEGFWINNIKSHCYMTFEKKEGAVACRNALHGTTWPSSNPKTLRVEFADANELNRFVGVTTPKKEAPKEKAREEPAAVAKRERISRQDRERDLEQEKRTREREREREKAQREREWDRGKERSQSRERRRRQRSEERRERHREIKKEIEEPPAKLLDDLFRKTKATPCIYWLPLTDEQIAEREGMKTKRVEKKEVPEERPPKVTRDREREDRDKRPREREWERQRPVRARERSWSRERRSRSRSRGRRR